MEKFEIQKKEVKSPTLPQLDILYPNTTSLDERIEKHTELMQQKEQVHRVEFINWKSYTICNVLVADVWRTCSFPATTSIFEFLTEGMINKCIHWPQGRHYTNEE